MEWEDLPKYLLVAAVVIVILVAANEVLQPQAQETPTPTPSPTPFMPTPVITPRATPRPSTSPNQTATPTQRWCNGTGCYWGIPPTPTPTPKPTPTPVITPSPVPVALWQQRGFKCVLPDNLVNEQWAMAFKLDCACQIRARMGLGPYVSLSEMCNAPQYTHDEDCVACINQVCKNSSGLC